MPILLSHECTLFGRVVLYELTKTHHDLSTAIDVVCSVENFEELFQFCLKVYFVRRVGDDELQLCELVEKQSMVLSIRRHAVLPLQLDCDVGAVLIHKNGISINTNVKNSFCFESVGVYASEYFVVSSIALKRCKLRTHHVLQDYTVRPVSPWHYCDLKTMGFQQIDVVYGNVVVYETELEDYQSERVDNFCAYCKFTLDKTAPRGMVMRCLDTEVPCGQTYWRRFCTGCFSSLAVKCPGCGNKASDNVARADLAMWQEEQRFKQRT